MKLRPTPLVLLIVAPFLFAGCDQIASRLGLEDPSSKEAKADAEGRAVGSACRQSGRAIEDCYSIYGWLPKSSIFAGWRDMNDYMQTNKLEIVEPKLPPPPGPGMRKKKAAEPSEDTAKAADGRGDGKPDPKEGKADAKAADGKPDAKSEAKPDDKAARAGEAKTAKAENKPENKAAAKQ
jgi:hypothetical protein